MINDKQTKPDGAEHSQVEEQTRQCAIGTERQITPEHDMGEQDQSNGQQHDEPKSENENMYHTL